jgi:hypothetical protein
MKLNTASAFVALLVLQLTAAAPLVIEKDNLNKREYHDNHMRQTREPVGIYEDNQKREEAEDVGSYKDAVTPGTGS